MWWGTSAQKVVGHFATFCPLEGHSKGTFPHFLHLEGQPAGHFTNFFALEGH